MDYLADQDNNVIQTILVIMIIRIILIIRII